MDDITNYRIRMTTFTRDALYLCTNYPGIERISQNTFINALILYAAAQMQDPTERQKLLDLALQFKLLRGLPPERP